MKLNLKAAAWTGFLSFNLASGALAFDFPKSIATSVGYFYTKSPTPLLRGKLVVSLEIVTSDPPPTFRFDTEPGNNCPTPATIRPFVWANHNNPYTEFDRWWSNPISFVLEKGSTILTVPFAGGAGSWSSVYGKFGDSSPKALQGYRNAMSNVSSIGFTLGGGCFFGHGVYIRGGTARLIIKSYEINLL